MTRSPLLALIPVVLLLPLAACGGGSGGFCRDGVETFAEADAIGALGDDPESFAEAVSELRSSFAEVDPPEEIADDWQAVSGLWSQAEQALAEVDTTDGAAVGQALTEVSDRADEDRLAAASEAISTYLAQHCTDPSPSASTT